MGNPESISLAYTEGSSNKVYNASLEAKGDKFIVNFSYGRRGSTLLTGTKTDKPVAYDKAKAIYDKLVREKMAKGYSPGSAGAAYQHTDKEQRATGIYPQLLNEIYEEEAEKLLTDDNYWAQEKHDGKRVLIKGDVDGIVGINKRGLTIGIPADIAAAASAIKLHGTLDGECVGEIFYAFDLRMGPEVETFMQARGIQQTPNWTHSNFASCTRRHQVSKNR
jgi:bifunctional non-homologous end joining protein LigD